jgi:hypothetical protein
MGTRVRADFAIRPQWLGLGVAGVSVKFYRSKECLMFGIVRDRAVQGFVELTQDSANRIPIGNEVVQELVE